MSKKKIFQLETFRGIAALIVFFWHFSLGFIPDFTGFFTQGKTGLLGTPLFFLMNGTASVAFFFVLSGFVLTTRFFETENADILFQGALKRYFRLMGPVALVVIISFLCFEYNLYFYSQAGALTSSPWLSDFANSGRGSHFEFSFFDAVKQGFYRTFIFGDNYYNTSLWTIQFELFGSFLAFGFAALLLKYKGTQRKIFMGIIAIIIARFYNTYYFCFLGGVLLAYAKSLNRVPKLSTKARIWAPFAIIVMFSANAPVGWYSFLRFIPKWGSFGQTMTYLMASVLLMIILLDEGRFTQFLSGNLGKFLGKISFPLYLLQVPILASFTSFFFVRFNNQIDRPLLISLLFLTTTILLVVTSWGLSIFDQVWVKWVGRIFGRKTS